MDRIHDDELGATAISPFVLQGRVDILSIPMLMRLEASRVSVAKRVANKMRDFNSVFAILAALLAAAPVWANEGKLVHLVRFTDYELGPVEYWLLSKGFQF